MAAETIIVADDHPLFRAALEQAVAQAFDAPEIVPAETLDALREIIAGDREADLLLLDLNMPGCRGYSALAFVRKWRPELPVIVVSAFDQPDVIRGAVSHGAAGFIPKSSDMATITGALRTVCDGGQWLPPEIDLAQDSPDQAFAERVNTLTPQQLRVLMMLTDGMLNKQIAIDLQISQATVKAHITAILRKLGVYTRTQAVIAARSLDIDWDAMARRGANAPAQPDAGE